MKRWVIGAVAATVILVLAVAGALYSPVTSVRDFQVTGTRHTTTQEVIDQTGIIPGTQLIKVDDSAAASKVVELAWVRQATVKKSWPHTVTVEIIERVPVAFVRRSDGEHLIDDTGKDFTIAQPPAEAVELTGKVVDNREDLADLVKIATQIDERTRAQIERIDAPSAANVTVELRDGRRVHWGATTNLHDKVRAFLAVLTQEGRNWDISDPTLVTVRP